MEMSGKRFLVHLILVSLLSACGGGGSGGGGEGAGGGGGGQGQGKDKNKKQNKNGQSDLDRFGRGHGKRKKKEGEGPKDGLNPVAVPEKKPDVKPKQERTKIMPKAVALGTDSEPQFGVFPASIQHVTAVEDGERKFSGEIVQISTEAEGHRPSF